MKYKERRYTTHQHHCPVCHQTPQLPAGRRTKRIANNLVLVEWYDHPRLGPMFVNDCGPRMGKYYVCQTCSADWYEVGANDIPV